MEKVKCKKCNKLFAYKLQGDVYPGGKFDEDIDCPYCGETYGTIMTSQFIVTEKLDVDQ